MKLPMMKVNIRDKQNNSSRGADEQHLTTAPLFQGAQLSPMSKSRTRVLAFDLARGVGIMGMVAVHVLLRYGSYTANQSIYGAMIRFWGGPLAAPVFMFLMGASLAFSTHATPRDGWRRGLALLALAYGLNFLRGTLPAFLGLEFGIVKPEDIAPYTLEDLFWLVDILHCAGISLMLITTVRYLLPRPRLWVFIGVVVALASPLMWGWMSGWPLLDGCLVLLWGEGKFVQFPVFPWISYSLTGMAFGVWLSTSVDQDALFRRAAGVGMTLLLAGGLLILSRPTFHIGDYFRSGPGAVIAFTGFVLVWLAVCHWLVGHVRGNPFFRLCYYWSAHVTIFFFIHWIIISWGIGFTGYIDRDNIPTLILLTIAVMALTDCLIRWWGWLTPRQIFLTAEAQRTPRKS